MHQQKAELAKLRQDIKDLGVELFKSNEKVTKLSVDCNTLLINPDNLNALVATQQKKIATLKEEALRRECTISRERESYFRSFPLSEVGRDLARTYRERLIARYNISGAFIKEAGKVASHFLGQLCQKFYDLNESKGFSLDFDAQAVVSSLPPAIPDWEGDASEDSTFEWWAGIREEAATTEIGAETEAQDGDQEAAPLE